MYFVFDYVLVNILVNGFTSRLSNVSIIKMMKPSLTSKLSAMHRWLSRILVYQKNIDHCARLAQLLHDGTQNLIDYDIT